MKKELFKEQRTELLRIVIIFLLFVGLLGFGFYKGFSCLSYKSSSRHGANYTCSKLCISRKFLGGNAHFEVYDDDDVISCTCKQRIGKLAVNFSRQEYDEVSIIK